MRGEGKGGGGLGFGKGRMRCVSSRDLRLWSFDNQELEGQGIVTGDTHLNKRN